MSPSDIEAKLQEDKLKLEALKNSLKKSSELTEKMTERLTQFDNRLIGLKDQIMPVYEEMQIKIRVQNNSDAAVKELDKVTNYYNIRTKVQSSITNDISSCVPDYISNMKELKSAIRFFKMTNPSSREVKQLDELFEIGLKSMCTEFKDMLIKKGKDRNLHPEELTTDEEQPPVLELLAPGPRKTLSLLSKWVVENHDYLKTCTSSIVKREIDPSSVPQAVSLICHHYKIIRSEYMRDNLERIANLENIYKYSATTPMVNRRFKGQGESVTRKGSRLSRDSARRTSKRGHKRTPSDHAGAIQTINEDINIEQSVKSFAKLSRAFAQLLRAEYFQVKELLPDVLVTRVFDDVISTSMDDFINEGKALIKAAQEQVTRSNWVAVFALITLHTNLTKVKTGLIDKDEFDFESPRLKLLTELITQLGVTIKEMLDIFRRYVEDDVVKTTNMASDGTVHQLTSTVMSFSETLLQYEETVGNMILGIQVEGFRQHRPNTKRQVSNFVNNILKALDTNLKSKAQVYENRSLSAVFLMNNYNYILKNLARSRILALLSDDHHDLERKYEDWIESEMQQYELWHKPLTDVMIETNRGAVIKDDKLKDSQKDAIKAKFKRFNTVIEEQLKEQKNWAIPDSHFRERIRQANAYAICEPYEEMRARYENVNFTSNKAKYLVHTVDEVQSFLNMFFDQKA